MYRPEESRKTSLASLGSLAVWEVNSLFLDLPDFLDFPRLSSQSKFLNDLVILFDITVLKIIEQFPATRDHLKQASTRVIVFLMDLKMLRQLVDPLTQQSDLHL